MPSYECDPCTECSEALLNDERMWKRFLIRLLCKLTGSQVKAGDSASGSAGTMVLFKNASGKAEQVSSTSRLPVDANVSIGNISIPGVSTEATLSSLNAKVTKCDTDNVAVSNFPDTQSVSGSVSVSNLPATQTVQGTVAVNNFPASQTVNGTVTFYPFPQVLGATQRSWNYTGDDLTGYTYKNAGGVTLATQTYTVVGGKITNEVWTWP